MAKSETNRKERLPVKKKVSTTSTDKKWTEMMSSLKDFYARNRTFKVPAGKDEPQEVKDLNEFVAQLKRSVKGTSPVVWKLTKRSRSTELKAIGFNKWVKNEETVKATEYREVGRKFLDDLAKHKKESGSYSVKQSDKGLGKMYKKIRHRSDKRSLTSMFTDEQLIQLTEWGVVGTKDRRQGNRGNCTIKVRPFNVFII